VDAAFTDRWTIMTHRVKNKTSARASPKTITLLLTMDEAVALGQMVDMARPSDVVAYWIDNRAKWVWSEECYDYEEHIPNIDEAGAIKMVQDTKEEILSKLRDRHGVEIDPPGRGD
jgi:hypothetical protein